MTDWERKRYKDVKKAYAALMKFYPFTLDDLDGEEWRDVIGYEGLYQESTFGRTKRLYKNGEAKILKPTPSTHGYLYVTLCINSQKKRYFIHRLVAEIFIANPDSKPQVNHIDGHRLNCHISNLEWATRSENMLHASQTGLIKLGEDNYQAKLTSEKAEYIRNNPDELTNAQLAKMFDISISGIRRVRHAQTYQNSGGIVHKPRKRFISADIRTEIRRLYAKGFSSRAIGKIYGIGHSTVLRIVKEGDAND